MQWWTYIIELVLLVLVIRKCSKAFKYSSINTLRHYIIPLYCFIVFLITMKWNTEDLIILAVLIPVSIAIGWYQTSQLKIKEGYDPKKHRIKYSFMRGWPLIVGWIVTIALGISLIAIFKRESIASLFDQKLVNDVIQDVDPFYIFTTSHPWYIWLISGVSALSDTFFTKRKLARFAKANPPKSIESYEKALDEHRKAVVEKTASMKAVYSSHDFSGSAVKEPGSTDFEKGKESEQTKAARDVKESQQTKPA